MTEQESIAVIKDLLAAKTKEELQNKMGAHLSAVDGAFFGVVTAAAQQLRAQGKLAAAQQLTQIGDALARLRFMI